MSVEKALGNLAMLFDIIPTFERSKLEAVQAGTAEFDYMLAAILFDLVRKTAYAHEALRRYALHADPDLTARVAGEIRELERCGQDYEALARRTEELMCDAIAQTRQDHMALADMLVRWHAGTGAATP